tara:strand:- start:212 stop:556 length:345 start_codon:yes stop_codon:yes gene_type:complete
MLAELHALLSSARGVSYEAQCAAAQAASLHGFDHELIWWYMGAGGDAAAASWLARSPAERAEEILTGAGRFAGEHHKAWAIDQALRCLMGPKRYLATRKQWAADDELHDEGIAP